MDGHVAKPVDYATLRRAVDGAIARCPQSWSTDHPAPPRDEVVEQPPPRLDRVVLEHLLAFLPPHEVAANFRSLRMRKEQMLRLMARSGTAMDGSETRTAMTNAAHALASTAGLFGFTALAVTARRFEGAVATDEPEVRPLSQQVHEETVAALAVLDALMRERWMQPA